MNLKALEILYSELDKLNTSLRKLPLGHWDEKPITEKRKIVTEAIEELEEYEQNFKQKEFDYRTQCQNVLSAGRLEADEQADRLAELEKVILDYYLDKGYQVGVGEWTFRVDIMSHYKQKGIYIYFYDNDDNESVYRFSSKTTNEMWDKAIKHFSLNTEPLQEDTKTELDDTNQSAIYKIAGYESDGRE